MQSRVGQLDCSHGMFSRLFQTEGALQAGDASLTSLAALQLAVNDSLLQFSLQQLCKRRLIPGQVIGSCSPARCVLHSELYHACTMLVLSGGNKISFMASYFPIHVIFTALPAVLLLFAAKFQKL